MTYCPNCGAPIEFRIPPGDDRKRNICSATGEVFYHNPLNVVGCIVEQDDAILMCRRAIEPRRGFWTMPAGFLELGETTCEGAARETREEALAEVADAVFFSMIDVTHIGQIHIFYRARLAGQGYGVGAESDEVVLLKEHEIDWQQLAFPTIHRTLNRYFADRARGRFGVHVESLYPDDWKAMQLARTPDMTARSC